MLQPFMPRLHYWHTLAYFNLCIELPLLHILNKLTKDALTMYTRPYNDKFSFVKCTYKVCNKLIYFYLKFESKINISSLTSVKDQLKVQTCSLKLNPILIQF